MLARTVTTGFALAIPIKLFFLRAGRRHPSMQPTRVRRLLWLLVPTETAMARTRAERIGVKRLGVRRLLRVCLKVALLVAIVRVKPSMQHLGPLLTFAVAFQVFFMISSVADLVTGLLGLFGVAAKDAFDRPYLSASLPEFWGRRWNTFVSDFLGSYFFRPLARRRRPLTGLWVAFLISGIAHEYFAVATVGWHLYRPGFMLLFFMCNGAAVALPAALPALGRLGARWPRHIGWTLHMVWVAATVPLFIEPLQPVLHAFDASVGGILQGGLGPLGGVGPDSGP
jgi:hypothetical protein